MSTPRPSRWKKREAPFFCVGMAIVPVFWVWWTSQSRFTRSQRVLALSWTAFWLAMAAFHQKALSEYLAGCAAMFPYICLVVAVCLWIWLLCRMGNWMAFVWLYLLFGGVWIHLWNDLKELALDRVPDYPLQPLVWIAIPALHHLIPELAERFHRVASVCLVRKYPWLRKFLSP